MNAFAVMALVALEAGVIALVASVAITVTKQWATNDWSERMLNLAIALIVSSLGVIVPAALLSACK